jgi:hypothetical protein
VVAAALAAAAAGAHPTGLSGLLTAEAHPVAFDRGWVVDDPVVANVDADLATTDQVDDGEPVIAVNPRKPNQVALLTGRDGGEWWWPGGCDPNPVSCPMGAGK